MKRLFWNLNVLIAPTVYVYLVFTFILHNCWLWKCYSTFSATLPLSLRVSIKGVLQDISTSFPESMKDPSPYSFLEFLIYWSLVGQLPQLFIPYHSGPPYFSNWPEVLLTKVCRAGFIFGLNSELKSHTVAVIDYRFLIGKMTSGNRLGKISAVERLLLLISRQQTISSGFCFVPIHWSQVMDLRFVVSVSYLI